MRTPLLTINIIVNNVYNVTALIDSSCLYYALVNKRFANQNCLKRFSIPPRRIKGINRKTS
jgi:hypothetical protein